MTGQTSGYAFAVMGMADCADIELITSFDAYERQ